jgi:DNA polymerase III gamma/tau subunit
MSEEPEQYEMALEPEAEITLPSLQEQNQRLEAQLAKQQAEMQQLRNSFSASQEAIAALKEVHAEATRIAVDRAKAELKAQLKVAREEGDVDTELAIRDQMDELNAQVRQAQQRPQQQQPAEEAAPTHPEWDAWHADNQWYGTDERRTLRAVGIAQELRGDPAYDHLQGRAFFDEVKRQLVEREAPRSGKLGGARPSPTAAASGGGGGARKPSYGDLPAEAKAACDRQGKKLVGEGRAFKDMNAWRSYYAGMYFQEQ